MRFWLCWVCVFVLVGGSRLAGGAGRWVNGALAADEAKRQEEQAKQDAINERQYWEDSLRTQAINNDTAKAQAAMKAADAAMYQSLNPQAPVNIWQPKFINYGEYPLTAGKYP